MKLSNNLLTSQFGFAIIDRCLNVVYSNDIFNEICQSLQKGTKCKPISLLCETLNIPFISHGAPIASTVDIDGKNYIVEVNPINMGTRDMYICTIINCTSSDYVYDFLSSEVILNSLILDSIEDGIFITDEKGNILYTNNSFYKLSGVKKEQIIGNNVYNLMKDNVLPQSRAAEIIDTNNAVSGINNYSSGKSCLVSGKPIFDQNGLLYRTVCIVRDVTELLKLEKEVEKTKNLSIRYESDIYGDKKNNIKNYPSNNKDIINIYEIADRISNYDSPVLILGETGTGKDFLASYIHANSNRANTGNFLKINCSAIPESLLESELFGYEAGAFTGANPKGKPGLFELANNGTLFLDEIGDMPPNLQVKILSALQDKVIFKLGGKKPIKINARIISATNININEYIEDKKFRLDLYYRLNVINIPLPPLRERKEDIVNLSSYFLKKYNAKYGQNKSFTQYLYRVLLAYDWPGNIREMKNLIERLIIISNEDLIDADIFIAQLDDIHKSKLINIENNMTNLTLKQKLELYEANIIKDALETTKNLQATSDVLQIDISTLVRKKKKYSL